jgi:Protein of unknown function (DUF1475)
MFLIRSLSLAGLVAMTIGIVAALSTGSFFSEGSALWDLPWGKVTLLDLYVGLAFFGAWIAFREKSKVRTVVWWVALLLLGNLASAVYLVIASFTSSSPRQLLVGDRA